MRVLICGSRDLNEYHAIEVVVRSYALAHTNCVVIEGDAPGADRLAGQAADRARVPVEKYPADWDKHGKKAAGPIRNKQMLVEGKPDVVWAFVNKPLEQSKGTHNMVKQAHAAGVPVYVVEAW